LSCPDLPGIAPFCPQSPINFHNTGDNSKTGEKRSYLAMDISALQKRVDKLLALATRSGGGSFDSANEVYQGTIAVLSAIYGHGCEQLKPLEEVAEKTIFKTPGHTYLSSTMLRALAGTLRNLKDELDGGFFGSLLKRTAGDVLTDFIQLARTVLDEHDEKAKNVAAVLTAAAYEDVIRRMGSTFAGMMGRDDLSKVIDALKEQGILVAPQLGIALAYLNFRNHALHANWEKIDRASVNSVLGFVEELLLKHFS